ncbi:MAG: NapC/NirT family cytochrome c [Candidatus Eisenbacteria bacterium]
MAKLRTDWLGFFRSMTAHPVGFVGVVTATTTGVLFLVFAAMSLLGAFEGPYKGIFTFMVLPGLFIAGLVLIPLGRFLRARGERFGVVVDLSRREQQRRVILFLILTGANVAILFLATYHGIHFTDSNTFCGEVCHTVMEPEYAAYQGSPHSRVPCVSCHIGPGADFFVKYKVNGMSQVFAVLFDTYERPIPSPVHNLRPARETCEQCHWPERFHGDKLLVKTHFDEDEQNTARETVMVLKVGGGGAESGFPSGIHWHTDPGNRVTYIAADEKREEIVWVEVERRDGSKSVYTKGGKPVADSLLASGERRRMDCIDCHNRPTHTFDDPALSLDGALAAGRLDTRLPYIKTTGLELLTAEYDSKEAALRSIPVALAAFYEENHPEIAREEGPSIEAAAEYLRALYDKNIFPDMNLSWNPHPNHVGHRNDGGCFRCHAGDHMNEEGDEIDSDCETCHTLLAMDEEDPEILKQILEP